MGRKASYRRNNVKEAAKDETAAKNVETVKEKVEAVKEKAEAAVEAVKENVKAEAVKAETAVTAKAETVKSAEKKETVEAATEKEAEQPKPRRGRPKKSETAAKETAAKAKTPVKNQLADLKRALKQRKNLLFSLRVNQLIRQQLLSSVEADLKAQNVIAKDIKLYVKPEDNKCYYVADEKITGDVELF